MVMKHDNCSMCEERYSRMIQRHETSTVIGDWLPEKTVNWLSFYKTFDCEMLSRDMYTDV